MRKGIAGKVLLTALAFCLLLGGLSVSGATNLFDPENAFDELYMKEVDDRPGVFTNSTERRESAREARRFMYRG